MKGVYYYNLVQLSSTTIHSSLKACVKKVDTQLNCNVGTIKSTSLQWLVPSNIAAPTMPINVLLS